MKLIKHIKEFWKINKYGYIWSCVALFLMGSFIGLIKHRDMSTMFLSILVAFPIIFLMAFGLSEFTGGSE